MNVAASNTLDDFRQSYNSTANTLTDLTNTPVVAGVYPVNQIYSGVVTSNTLVANNLSTNALTSNTLSTNLLTSNTLTSSMLTTNTLLTNLLTSNTLTSNTLTSNTLTSNTLSTNALTSNTLVANTLTSNTIVANTLSANSLTSGRVAIIGTNGLIQDDAGIAYDPTTDVLTLSGTIDSTTPLNGTLVVSGGVGISKNLRVAGDTYVSGNLIILGSNTELSTTQININDPLLQLANNNTSDLIDIGIFGQYNSGAANLHSGLFRDATDGVWKLFKSYSAEPTTKISTSANNFAYADLNVNSLKLLGGTANGIAYINSSNVLTTGSALTFNGANVGITGTLVSANISGSTGATISSFITDGTLSANNNTTVPTTAAVRAYVASNIVSGGSTFSLTISNALAYTTINPIPSGWTPSSGQTYAYSGRGKYGTNGNCFFHSAGMRTSSQSSIGFRSFTVNPTTGAITINAQTNVFLNNSTSVGLSTTWMQQDELSGKTMWFGNSGWSGTSTNRFGYAWATVDESGTITSSGSAEDAISHYRNGTMRCLGRSDQGGWYGMSSGYNYNNSSIAAINRWNYTGSSPSSVGAVNYSSDTSTSYHVNLHGQLNLNGSAVNVAGMGYYRVNSSTYYLRVYDATMSNFTDHNTNLLWGFGENAFQLSSGVLIHYSIQGTYVYTAYNSRTLVTPSGIPSFMDGRNQSASICWIGPNTWMASTADSPNQNSFICFRIDPSTYALTYRRLEFGGLAAFEGSNLSVFTSGPSQQHLVVMSNLSNGYASTLVYNNPFATLFNT